MKVLFHTDLPFCLAHGGVQTLTEQLMRHVADAGAAVEPLRWWDADQTANIIHYIGRPTDARVSMAQAKRFRVVFTDLLDSTASRPPIVHWAQQAANGLLRRAVPLLARRLGWNTYRRADAVIYLVGHEVGISRRLFGTPSERAHVIPLGLSADALAALAQPAPESDYLVSLATIAPPKNSLLLAQAARRARVPVMFVGRPYAEDGPYFRAFESEIDDRYVRYAGYVSETEKIERLRQARGFVLMSRRESGCIAIHEAAAAGLPMLLSKLPWAANSYPRDYIHLQGLRGTGAVAAGLRTFYDHAHRQPAPTMPVLSWQDVAARHIALYDDVLRH